MATVVVLFHRADRRLSQAAWRPACWALFLLACLACARQRGAEAAPPLSAEPERLLEMGLLREQAGDGLRAEQYYEVALALGADSAVVYPRLIAVCLAGGRLSSALVHVEHALEDTPNEPHLVALRDALGQALGEP